MGKLGEKNPGDIVKIKENNVLMDFIVLQHNYPNPTDANTLILRKDLIERVQWNTTLVNAYSGSYIDNWLNTTYMNKLDPAVQECISSVTIPYTIGNMDWTVSTITRQIFLLSLTELGISHANANVEGVAIPYFSSNTTRIAKYNNSPFYWWTRSPFINVDKTAAQAIDVDGDRMISQLAVTNDWGARPAFCFPSNAVVTDDGEITGEVDNSGVMLIPSSALVAGETYNIRIFPRNNYSQFQTAIDGSSLQITFTSGQSAEAYSIAEARAKEMEQALTILGVDVNV